MRANRLLGANLVEANLVKLEDLEPANERLLSLADTEMPRQCTVLGVLAYEMKVLREEDVLQHVVDNEGAGLVDLRNYETLEELKKTMDLDACWATWSVPEKHLNGPILWFGTTLEGIADHLEKIAADRALMPPMPVPTAASLPA